jgi:hypothetical protein
MADRNPRLTVSESLLGIVIKTPQPFIKYIANGQGVIDTVSEPVSKLHRCTCSYALKQLKEVGKECAAQRGGLPNLMVVILPERANEIYTAVKQYVALSCLNFFVLIGPTS